MKRQNLYQLVKINLIFILIFFIYFVFVKDVSGPPSRTHPDSAKKFLRSITVTGDYEASKMYCSSKYNDQSEGHSPDQYSVDNELSSKLKRFRGIKRNIAFSEKPRSTICSYQLRVSLFK